MKEKLGKKVRLLKLSMITGSALGLLAIGSLIAIFSLIPLYNRLKQQEEKQLIFSAQMIAARISDRVDKAIEAGESIAHRDSYQKLFSMLNLADSISAQTLETTENKFRDLLDESVVGMAYLKNGGAPILNVGVPISPEFLAKPKVKTPSGWVVGPLEIDDTLHLLIGTSVGRDRTHLLLFRLSNVRELIENQTHFSSSNSVLLAIEENRQVWPLSIWSDRPTDEIAQLLADPAILTALQKGGRTDPIALWCRTCNDFIAYSPIQNINWGLIVAENKRKLYGPVYQYISLLAGGMLLLILLGTGALISALRPLANRMQREILERQKAEIALQKEKDFTQTLFDANPAFLIVLDVEGQVKLMNPVMLNTLGYTQEEIEGMNYTATFVPKKGDSSSWIFELMINRRLPIRTEEYVVARDGREIIVEWHGRAVFNEETGEYEYFVGAGLDITDRKRAEEELRLLQQITRAVSIAPNFDAALEVALHSLCQTTGWEFGEAWIPNPEKTRLEYSSVSYGSEANAVAFRTKSQEFLLKFNAGLPGRVWASQQPEWTPDISRESGGKFPRRHLAKQCGFKAGFGVPILADGQVLAILVFLMSAPREKDPRLVELVSSVATQLGSVFQRKQAEAKYRNIFENALEGIFQLDLRGKFISANPALATILGYESEAELIAQGAEIKYLDAKTPRQFIHLLQTRGSVSNFEAQVCRRDGSSIWILQNARAICSDRDRRVLYYEGSIIEMTHLKKTEEKLRHSASHDSLTNLWNRSFFLKRLERSIKRCQEGENYGFAVLFLDLDGFKFINDSLGHGVGDRLLIEIGQRLKTCLRPEDILARLGGDEFTVLLENTLNLTEAIDTAQRIQKALRQPFILQEHQIFTGASIGIVQGTPDYQSSPEVLRDADTAMYRAKQQGKGCSVVFDATMRTDALRRLYLQTQLRLALERQEFQLHYQPIVELANGQIAGFEALLRWNHPEEGLISPGEFIPVAEEAGLIVEIGEWVLRQACYQLSDWKERFSIYSSLMMSVNLSSQQFTADLSRRISQILIETGVGGSELKLEITETAIMADPQLAIATLTQLKHQQIKICIDDFGTGYCSLGYLHQFPVDILKIDRSFVNQVTCEEDKREIVRVIVALAHSLRMDAIAEGIETAEQLHQLQQFNCKYGQGYFFFRPLNCEAVEALLSRPATELQPPMPR
ncbi:MAG: EAL domain-containing protein [Limnospira sp.]